MSRNLHPRVVCDHATVRQQFLSPPGYDTTKEKARRRIPFLSLFLPGKELGALSAQEGGGREETEVLAAPATARQLEVNALAYIGIHGLHNWTLSCLHPHTPQPSHCSPQPPDHTSSLQTLGIFLPRVCSPHITHLTDLPL